MARPSLEQAPYSFASSSPSSEFFPDEANPDSPVTPVTPTKPNTHGHGDRTVISWPTRHGKDARLSLPPPTRPKSKMLISWTPPDVEKQEDSGDTSGHPSTTDVNMTIPSSHDGTPQPSRILRKQRPLKIEIPPAVWNERPSVRELQTPNTPFTPYRDGESPYCETPPMSARGSTSFFNYMPPNSATTAPTSARDGSFEISPAPLILPIPTFKPKEEHTEYDTTTDPTTAAVAAAGDPPPPFKTRVATYLRAWFQRNYYLVNDNPPLVLPSAPTDGEKTSFLEVHRFWMCTGGVFAFLSSSAGIWLFTLCGSVFYFFAAFAGFLQAYLALFHLTGVLSKDFDYAAHEKAVRELGISLDEADAADAPSVDVFLPCCKEPIDILENTYRYVTELTYPTSRLIVHVLDDGAQPEVEALAKSYGFNYICRDDRPRLKKAGNLRWAFARTEGEFFVIFDADFCPRADYLTELIPRMKNDPKIAIIQTPQYFRTLDDQTWVERGAGAVQELFYRFIQVNRNKWGGSICVGSNATYRRAALVETGGTAEVGASEDVHTGFYAVTHGWKVDYVPLCLACGICPDTPRAFFSQQLRWCQGSTSLLINKHFWTSNLTIAQKTCYLSGMLYYSATALSIFTNPLPGILLIWFRVQYVLFYNLAFAIPSLLYGWFLYRIWGRSKHAMCVQFIGVIQQYAYLSALKDRVLGTSFTWVPSGDTKAHKSTRYRNMRWFCICWNFITTSFFIAGVVYRMLGGHPWYDFFPLILLNIYTIYKALPYMMAA